MNNNGIPSHKVSFLGKVLTQIFVLVVCIGVPALVTAIAPVSWLKFERNGQQVVAQAKTCLLFIIPYKTRMVESVTAIDSRIKTGSVTRHRRSGPDKYTKSEDEGFLIIKGANQTAEVSVDPNDLESVTEKVNDFLQDKEEQELKLFVADHWTFSVIVGGIASLLTILYIGGLCYGSIRGILRLLGLVRKPA